MAVVGHTNQKHQLICQHCQSEFLGRQDAKTCGTTCRAGLKRGSIKKPGKKPIVLPLVVAPALDPTEANAIIYALREENGNIYYVGSSSTKAMKKRHHIMPPTAEMLILRTVPGKERFIEEQKTLDEMRALGHTLVNKQKAKG